MMTITGANLSANEELTVLRALRSRRWDLADSAEEARQKGDELQAGPLQYEADLITSVLVKCGYEDPISEDPEL